MKRTILLLSGLVILSTLFLSSCGLLQPRVVTLCTNRPELAAYVEHFNSLSPDHRVVLCYQNNPARTMTARNRDADLVLGPWLNGSEARRHFESVEGLFNREYLRRADFYTGVLSAGMGESRQLLLPFSFKLPAMVFPAQEVSEDLSGLIISLEYLSERAPEFNESVRERPVRMGYSPLWQEQFLYSTAASFGVQFRETSAGSVLWNSARLQDMKEFCSRWVEGGNPGFEQDLRFQRSYLYEPMPKLLDSGRILFYMTDSAALFTALEDHVQEVDFRWLGSETRIPVDEGVLYFGIPRGSRNRRGARLFLAWIFQPETQGRLLDINQEKRLDTFGLAGGFSALRSVNEREFPRVYKQLLGRIPPEEQLMFARTLPVDWPEQRQTVVVPWLMSYVSGRADEQILSQRLLEFRSP